MFSKKSMMFALMLVAASLGQIGWARAGVARPAEAPQLEASFDLPTEEGVACAEEAPQLEASFDLPTEEGVARAAEAPQLEASFDLPTEEGVAGDAFAIQLGHSCITGGTITD